MLRTIITSSVISFLLAVSATPVFAQTDEGGTLVADVAVTNALIVNQEQNVFGISFEIVNRMGVQSDIAYGINLVTTGESPQLVHQEGHMVPHALQEGESWYTEFRYIAPEFLNGAYQIVLWSETKGGLPLAIAPLGEVELTGTGEYVWIDSASCVTENIGEEGVSTTCSAESFFREEVSLSPFAVITKDSFSGDGITAQQLTSTPLVIAPGESEISFEVPLPSQQGQFAAMIGLEDANGVLLSNSVPLMYSGGVPYASIRNVALDNDLYRRGDAASVQITYLLPVEEALLSVSVLDANGDMCSEEIEGMRIAAADGFVVVPVAITSSCSSPEVSVQIFDTESNLLAEHTTLATQERDTEGFSTSLIIVAVIVLLLIIVGVAYLLNKKDTNETMKLSAVALFALSIGFLSLMPTQVNAGSWTKSTGVPQCHFYVNGGISATPSSFGIYFSTTTYDANSPIYFHYTADNSCTSSWYSNYGSCYGCSTHATVNMRARINSGSYTTNVTPSYVMYRASSILMSTPSSVGSHNMNFSAQMSSGYIENGKTYTINGSVGFTVQGSLPDPTATLNASPGTINSGGSSTLSWSCTNSDSARIGGTGSVATSGSMSKSPSSSTTYTLTCYGSNGNNATDTARITVNQPAPSPTASFSASPTTVVRGSQTRLQWSSANAPSCTGWEFGTNGATSGTKYVTVWNNTTYGVNCGGATASQYVAVTDPAPGVPTVTLTASPSTISSGGNSTLTWNSSNTSTCSGSGSGFSTGNATNGSDGVSPSSTTTYSITCTGPGGSDTDTATVSVSAPASVTANLSVDDNSITRGDSTTLRWSSSNATTCSGSGSGFSTGNATNGSDGISPTSSTTYTVTCSGSGGSASDSVSVSVSSPPSPPSASIEVRNTTQGGSWTGNNITINAGDQIALRWDSSNASSCNGSNFSTGGADDGETTTVTEPSAGSDTVYSVSCSSASDSLRVTALGTTPELASNKSQVRQGESVTLSYNMQGNDPTQCTLVGPGVSYLAGSFSGQTGTLSVSISGDSTYTLTCPGGEADVTVEIIPIIFDS